MGEYVSISIDNLDVLTYKNRIGDLLLVFNDAELHIESFLEDGEERIRRYYSATVEDVRRRLDVLGYTLKRAKEVFEEQKKEACDWYCDEEEYLSRYILEYSYEEWEKAIKNIAKEEARLRTKSFFYPDVEIEESRPFAEKEIIKSMSDGYDSFWGIYVDCYIEQDKHNEIGWLVLRVITEAFSKNKNVIVDYTYLYEGGWCEEIFAEEIIRAPRTIILTEGKFDISVLSRTIKLLYPGMDKYYSFFDFETFRTKGSTDSVVSYIKAFASAGIENRVIALLDNDAAGVEAETQLLEIKLPNNFRVMTLPDVKIAEKYPTVGPTKNEKVDVNGRACSIEMYLGRDVLKDGEEIEPVMWEGYREKVKRYQGKLLNKAAIQNRFEEKLSNAIDAGIKDENDWLELKLVFEQIFTAFLD